MEMGDFCCGQEWGWHWVEETRRWWLLQQKLIKGR
jgi:hypothetical protein